MISLNIAEAFEVVLIESMLHGIQIVAPDIEGSGMPWENQRRVTGINYPVGDVSSIALACYGFKDSETSLPKAPDNGIQPILIWSVRLKKFERLQFRVSEKRLMSFR